MAEAETARAEDPGEGEGDPTAEAVNGEEKHAKKQPSSTSKKKGVIEEPLAEEHVVAVVAQLEFYFSDANVVTDAWLRPRIERSEGGWINLGEVCAFPKLKQKLKRRAWSAVVPEAVRRLGSDVVEVSEDGMNIRRLHAIPEFDLDEIRSRSCVVENHSGEWTVESLRGVFADWSVVNVRIRHPGQGKLEVEKRVASGVDLVASNSNKTHAIVEFESADAAKEAMGKLDNPSDWRNGLRVRVLLKPGQKKKKKAVNKPLKTPEPEQSATDEGDEGEGLESKTEEPAPKTKSKGKKKKPDYSKWASVAAFNENKTIISTIGGEETDEHHQTEEERALGKDLQQKLAVATSRSPTMPDGSPGFTRARTCVAPDLAICSQTSCDS